MKLLITRTLTLFIEHHFIARVREPGPTHLKKCLIKQPPNRTLTLKMKGNLVISKGYTQNTRELRVDEVG